MIGIDDASVCIGAPSNGCKYWLVMAVCNILATGEASDSTIVGSIEPSGL